MNLAKLKLHGAHPAFITREELKTNPRVCKAEKQRGFSLVTALDHIGPGETTARLTVEEQTRALIHQAMDPNLIGRIYGGWEPCL